MRVLLASVRRDCHLCAAADAVIRSLKFQASRQVLLTFRSEVGGCAKRASPCMSPPAAPLPAHTTKHESVLQDYPLTRLNTTVTLHQSDAQGSTGTTLWLGAQLLCEYLQHKYSKERRPMKTIDLGSGVGRADCVLSSYPPITHILL
jgi:hypothetical protein